MELEFIAYKYKEDNEQVKQQNIMQRKQIHRLQRNIKYMEQNTWNTMH